ncbi:MAG: hypothetical protein GX444_04920 [Myxococcales bacterium]|nr:hypothetical protein [Myxococcales bacterium]
MKIRRKVPSVWCALCLAVLTGLLFGCAKQFEVLSEREIDRLPVIIQLGGSVPGFQTGDTLLALVPAIYSKTSHSRGLAEVIAVYNQTKKQWQSLGEGNPWQLRSLDYKFATIDSLNLSGILLPGNLGRREPVNDRLNKAIWVRTCHTGSSLIIEVAFGTEPLTVRKIQYQPSVDGLTVELEKGSLLQVREK